MFSIANWNNSIQKFQTRKAFLEDLHNMEPINLIFSPISSEQNINIKHYYNQQPT